MNLTISNNSATLNAEQDALLQMVTCKFYTKVIHYGLWGKKKCLGIFQLMKRKCWTLLNQRNFKYDPSTLKGKKNNNIKMQKKNK